jgi:hypothetical protein
MHGYSATAYIGTGDDEYAGEHFHAQCFEYLINTGAARSGFELTEVYFMFRQAPDCGLCCQSLERIFPVDEGDDFAD